MGRCALQAIFRRDFRQKMEEAAELPPSTPDVIDAGMK
jgi:hypothetical protein